MANKKEKARRRAIVQKLKQDEYAKAEASMPISKADLHDLFEELDSTLFEKRDAKVFCLCDGTQKRSKEFLRARWLAVEEISEWLHEYGGHCDCEVIYNVRNYWGEHVGY